MGNGNINFSYDVNRAPEADDRLPVWYYRWGSEQMGITPGHLQALFYWEKLEERRQTTKQNLTSLDSSKKEQHTTASIR